MLRYHEWALKLDAIRSDDLNHLIDSPFMPQDSLESSTITIPSSQMRHPDTDKLITCRTVGVAQEQSTCLAYTGSRFNSLLIKIKNQNHLQRKLENRRNLNTDPGYQKGFLKEVTPVV